MALKGGTAIDLTIFNLLRLALEWQIPMRSEVCGSLTAKEGMKGQASGGGQVLIFWHSDSKMVVRSDK
ncbi:MAG: hypothetical protein ACYCXI_06275 [Dethiobacteraceae bacterium]